MKVIRESYRAGESWPFFVTLERGEEIRGYLRVNYDALLALADDIDRSALELLKTNDLDPNRKRRAMRREHAQDLMAVSSRIRKALGEE